jgi:nicotinate-nucleotide adenylyltransferase
MGADSWLTIGKWYRAAELLMACDFIVGTRPGFDRGELTAALPEGIAESGVDENVGCNDHTAHCRVSVLTGPENKSAHLYVLTDLNEDVSATEIRSALAAGPGLPPFARVMLDPAVERYIEDHRLYSIH